MWGLSSLTRIEHVPPAVEAQSPNHWIAREVLFLFLRILSLLYQELIIVLFIMIIYLLLYILFPNGLIDSFTK